MTFIISIESKFRREKNARKNDITFQSQHLAINIARARMLPYTEISLKKFTNLKKKLRATKEITSKKITELPTLLTD